LLILGSLLWSLPLLVWLLFGLLGHPTQTSKETLAAFHLWLFLTGLVGPRSRLLLLLVRTRADALEQLGEAALTLACGTSCRG
jgi:hypothetical protein